MGPAASLDFEFSVSKYSVVSVDELFFKGRLLPFKDKHGSSSSQMQRTTTTLREELQHDDTTKDTGHAGGRISLHSGGSNRRHDSTAFIPNAGELSVGKLRSCVSETAGTF